MLAACVASGWDPANYLLPEHPLQRRITDFMNDVAGPVEPVGVDGCGAPVFRTTVRAMAGAFSQLATASELNQISAVMHAYPQLIAGPGRPDSAIATALNAVAKGGARGTMGVGIRGRLGIAVKCWDGSDMVTGIAAVAALRQIGELPTHAEKALERVGNPVVMGGDGVAGSFRSTLELRWS
jgi:L-asparaginase II